VQSEWCHDTLGFHSYKLQYIGEVAISHGLAHLLSVLLPGAHDPQIAGVVGALGPAGRGGVLCLGMARAPSPVVMARRIRVVLILGLQVFIIILGDLAILLQLSTRILATLPPVIVVPPSALALPTATHFSPRVALLDPGAFFQNRQRLMRCGVCVVRPIIPT
jgi:hypothetical protein